MKILIYEPTGGLCNYSLNLAYGLTKNGCNISLITMKDFDNYFFNYSKKINIIPLCNSFLIPEWLQKRGLFPLERIYKTYIIWYNISIRRKICYQLKPNIIHLQITHPIIDQFYINDLSKHIKTVLTVHDVRWHNRKSLNNIKLFLKNVYTYVNKLIVHSCENKKQLINEFKLPENKISIIPFGTELPLNDSVSKDDARKILTLPLKSKLILFFGTIRENKGLDILLQSIKDIQKKIPNIKLIIAGKLVPFDTFNKYNLMINTLKLTDNIILRIGRVKNEDVELYFKASDLTVLPYKNTYSSQSGVLFDAYKYQCPLVVTNVGGIGETVSEDKTGIVVDSTNKYITNAIIRLIEDEQLNKSIKDNMISAIKSKYSWDIVAKKTIDVYNSILN